MTLTKIAQGLHVYERRVLPEIQNHPTVQELSTVTGLKDVEVVRALQWLENKGAVKVDTTAQEYVVLDKNGKKYLKEGLPERQFLKTLSDKPLTLKQLKKEIGLSSDELNICLGLLRRKSAIYLKHDKELAVTITDQGKDLLGRELLEEQFLNKDFPILVSDLSAEEKKAFSTLRKRKNIIDVETKKIKKATLTDLGRKLIAHGVRDESVVDKITPQMLREGTWQNKTFRRYDVTLDVPSINGGKKQPYRAFLDRIRQKFIALGFEEMDGPLVETELYNMDALYMPQFHSARDIHDAYYIKNPKQGQLDPKLVKRIKAAHEDGGKTGSLGWRYPFSVERTHRFLLRTQGTACSARKLASPTLSVPGKYFGITRVFRHDVIDATHLPDFNQTEGIIVEENLNFSHLVGLLKTFAREFASTDKIKLVPGYFPFTEPSAELFAKHPQLGWVELGGAGIFRPEVVEPILGKPMSVLAWGLGIDRLGMFNLGLKDIRDLFSQDVAFLRKTPVI